jgi:hypothetical protein
LNSFGTSTLTPESCVAALRLFYDDVFESKVQGDRVYLSLPLMNADGYQITLALEQITEHQAILTDLGETLAFLDLRGLSTRHPSIKDLIDRRLTTFEIERRGEELLKVIPLPVEGLDIQLFAEALSGLTYMIFRHEHSQPRNVHVYSRVKEHLQRANAHFLTGKDAFVAGKTSKVIPVDFLLTGKIPVAVKTVQRRGRMHDYMEQWGFRWVDAKQADSRLIRAMLYDPENQEWDENSLEIGKHYCEIFLPYYESEAFRDDLARLHVIK